MRFFIRSGLLSHYHKGMIIVKMRPSARRFIASAMTRNLMEGLTGSPGLSALSVLERAGMIKRVTPLVPSADQRIATMGLHSRTAVLAAVAEQADSSIANAGVSIVELERDEDVLNVQMGLANDPNVEYVSRVPVRYFLSTLPSRHRSKMKITAVPPPVTSMWNLRKIKWNEARRIKNFKEASKIKVAVLDTGIDTNHPDLRADIASYVYLHPDIAGISSDQDIVGHGTHVTGTIGAGINNDIGINGICKCQLYIWKIFDDEPDLVYDSFTYFVEPVMYQRALADCLDKGIDVVNLSIGGPGRPDPNETDLFRMLMEKNTTIVAAMGNEGEDNSPISYPAAIPGVIAVGATTIDDTIASFSSRGNHISLSAPGVGIWSALPTYPGQIEFRAVPGSDGSLIPGSPIPRDTNYIDWQGTSMASPHVAGAAALLLANKGRMSSFLVRERLMQTADKVPGMRGSNFTTEYGAGRLNLFRLLSE